MKESLSLREHMSVEVAMHVLYVGISIVHWWLDVVVNTIVPFWLNIISNSSVVRKK